MIAWSIWRPVMRRMKVALLLALVVAGWQVKSTSGLDYCPFCGGAQGQTLVKEVQQARFVLYGVPSNPQIKRDAEGREFGTTDFTIEEVVKNDPFLKNKKTLTLPRYVPPTGTGEEKVLLFCDLSNDQFDAYLMMSVKDSVVVKYLKEAIKLDEKDTSKRLKFFFNYLDHFDNEVASDAYKEFAKADYADVVKLVKDHGGADMHKRLITWMKDPNTAIYRYGLFGLMLGLCGKQEDGEVFLSLLNDPDKSLMSGIDGILAGYILVDIGNAIAEFPEMVHRSTVGCIGVVGKGEGADHHTAGIITRCKAHNGQQSFIYLELPGGIQAAALCDLRPVKTGCCRHITGIDGAGNSTGTDLMPLNTGGRVENR